MFVAALFRHDGIPGNVLRGALDRASLVIQDANAVLGEDGDVAIGEEKDVAGVLKKCGDVARDEIFVVAEANHGGRAETSGNDFLRVFSRKEHERVDAAQLFQ